MKSRRPASGLLACILAIVPAALACGGERDGAPEAEDDVGLAAVLAAIAANPCDAMLTTRMDPADTVLARILTGTIDLANEAHDCQRLVLATEAEPEFGPLVGLFPVDATLGLARDEFASARPAVSVYSWGAAGAPYPEDYPALGLSRGPHCLWLQNSTGAADGWRAGLVAGLCGEAPTPPAEPDLDLSVFERTYPGAAAVDYPKTARWEWDLDAEGQFFGVKCGDAWCAVTSESSRPRTTPLPEQLRGYDLARLRVPGWSDAQHLAVFDSAAGQARPGPWGTLLSHPFLHDEEPLWSEGILAAAIEVEDDGTAAYDRFSERWYLQPGGGGGRGDVILRFPGISPNEVWYQQGPMRRRQGGAVRYTPAMMNPATGAVRWRWREDGPELWMFCREGSCAVEG